MKFTIIFVDDPNQYKTTMIDEYAVYQSSLPDGYALVTKDQLVGPVAKRLSERYPNRDVFILEQTESFFSTSSPVQRKKYDTTTGEFVPV
jgi:hypothetical protein